MLCCNIIDYIFTLCKISEGPSQSMQPWPKICIYCESNGTYRNEIDSRLQEAKRLMGLQAHRDGFQPAKSLEWQSEVA